MVTLPFITSGIAELCIIKTQLIYCFCYIIYHYYITQPSIPSIYIYITSQQYFPGLIGSSNVSNPGERSSAAIEC